MKSAEEAKRLEPPIYEATHYELGEFDYVDALNAGHRFFTLAGNELKSERAARAAIARDGSVVSR